MTAMGAGALRRMTRLPVDFRHASGVPSFAAFDHRCLWGRERSFRAFSRFWRDASRHDPSSTARHEHRRDAQPPVAQIIDRRIRVFQGIDPGAGSDGYSRRQRLELFRIRRVKFATD